MTTTRIRGISFRLGGGALLLAAALAGVAAFSHLRLSSVTAVASRTGEVRVPQLARVAHMELEVTRASLQLRHAMLARTPQERAAALTDVAAKREARGAGATAG